MIPKLCELNEQKGNNYFPAKRIRTSRSKVCRRAAKGGGTRFGKRVCKRIKRTFRESKQRFPKRPGDRRLSAAMSMNGWRDDQLSCSFLRRNFSAAVSRASPKTLIWPIRPSASNYFPAVLSLRRQKCRGAGPEKQKRIFGCGLLLLGEINPEPSRYLNVQPPTAHFFFKDCATISEQRKTYKPHSTTPPPDIQFAAKLKTQKFELFG